MTNDPRWVFVVIGAYAWSALLAYFAFREQFALSHVETMVVGALCLLAIATGWHYSRKATDVLVTGVLRAQRLESAAAAAQSSKAHPVARTPKKAFRHRTTAK